MNEFTFSPHASPLSLSPPLGEIADRAAQFVVIIGGRRSSTVVPAGAASGFSGFLRGSGRGISSSNFSFRPKGAAGNGNSGDKDGEDADADEDEKPKRGKKRIEISDEEIASEPMDYIFAGVPPDFKAPRLSDEVKEKMWKAYCDSPNDEMIDRLAERFKIRKQRVHAILWLKEIEKKRGGCAWSSIRGRY